MKQFVVGVGGALFKNGKLLVLKRNSDKKTRPNDWEIPGGKIEIGEQPAEALKREFMEETGLEIEVGKPFHSWSYVDDDRFYVEIDYLVTCKTAGEIKLSPAEHCEWKWINQWNEVQCSKDMLEANRKAFETLKEK
ncbi:MAG: NUDIX domain-containing protein [Candidatus Micrarchaeota archaeon]|nr:NUDIX domain-containing protein [Candidatus Micrarchaeota archaeon]